MSLASTQQETEGQDLTYDTVFFTLSNPRRRFALHHLKQVAEPISVGELATQVAAWENGVSVENVTNRQRKRVYTSLHQTHLPKLDEIGIVEYDKGRGVVHPVAALPKIDFYLEISPENDLPWHSYYLGLGVLALALTLAAWVEPFPFNAVPDIAYIAFVAGVLTLSAAVHTRRARQYRFGGDGLPPSLSRLRDRGDFPPGEDE